MTWEMQEPGWYTHPKLGGIVHTAPRRWWWYPLDSDDEHGPYRTLREAEEAAEVKR